MSEEKVEKEDGAEPSMEDILASIRRILAEEDGGEEAVTAAAETAPKPKPTSEPESETEPALGAEPADEPEPMSPPDPAPEAEPAPSQPTIAATPPPPQPEPADSILELTREMIAPADVMSSTTMQQSSDLLGDLARAILDRRDFRVADAGGNANITLESLVREMLRPLLREWLDRNLPYLIERLVKKEIDLMVNRAQDLDENY